MMKPLKLTRNLFCSVVVCLAATLLFTGSLIFYSGQKRDKRTAYLRDSTPLSDSFFDYSQISAKDVSKLREITLVLWKDKYAVGRQTKDAAVRENLENHNRILRDALVQKEGPFNKWDKEEALFKKEMSLVSRDLQVEEKKRKRRRKRKRKSNQALNPTSSEEVVNLRSNEEQESRKNKAGYFRVSSLNLGDIKTSEPKPDIITPKPKGSVFVSHLPISVETKKERKEQNSRTVLSDCNDADGDLDCPPADIYQRCNKYNRNARFSSCLNTCIPSFCCIHDSASKVLHPSCSRDPNCRYYSACYIVWWKLHDTIGPATFVQVEQNEDFYDVSAKEFINFIASNPDFSPQLYQHHFDDDTPRGPDFFRDKNNWTP